MRPLILFFLLLFTQAIHGTSPDVEKVQYYRAAWLESALEASAMVYGNHKATVSQKMEAMNFQMFYVGMIRGINLSCFFYENSDPLHYPDREFMDLEEAIYPLMAFIKEQRAFIREDTKAQDIIFAWYLTAHSKSTEKQKFFGRNYLEARMRKGE